MTTHEDLIATLTEIEQQLAQDKVTVENLQSSLEDCDRHEMFAIAPELIPDLDTAPRRVNRPVVLPAHFIRV